MTSEAITRTENNNVSSPHHTNGNGPGTSQTASDLDDIHVRVGNAVTRREDATEDYTLMYGVEDRPPWHLLVLLSFQNVLTEFGSLLGYPYLISTALCIDADRVGFSELLSTVIFIAGLASLIQSAAGSRLPLLQGASYSFIMPVLVLMKTNEHLCPNFDNPANGTLPFERASEEHKDLWKSNLNEINGSLMVASLFQTLIGATGLIGVIARYISPMTVSAVFCLIGLSVFQAAAEKGATHWWICMLTIFLAILFSQYLRNVSVPFFGGTRLHVFTMFPILMSVTLAWLVCLILTVTNVFPNKVGQWGYLARTDIKSSAIEDTKWFKVPYPGQWGMPTISVGGVLGMIAAMTASIIESVGDYYACAVICNVPTPPASAINRGIALEGFGCFLGGAFGSGCGNTSYGSNMATISLTKVGSRAVIHGAGLTLLLLGCLGKFGGFFAMIPEAIIGGLLFIVIGMIVAVSISNLQSTDVRSTRNMFVFGFSVIFGLCVSDWVTRNPIDIGDKTGNQVLNVMCGTGMFLGGVVSFILDNTIPGTRKERGLLFDKTDDHYTKKELKVYDLPLKFLNTWKYFRYIPFFPGWDARKAEMNKIIPLQKIQKEEAA